MKILHVFAVMNRGGAEIRTLELMRAVDRQQFQFHFCVVTGLPGVLDDEIRALGGEIYYLPLNIEFIRRFRQLLRNEQYDIVHSHVNFVSGFILCIAATAKIPKLIAHFRGTYERNTVPPFRRLINWILWGLINKYATHIIAVSRSSMSTYFRSDWERDQRCHVIYNGLDLTRYQEPSDRLGVRREFNLPEACKLYIHVARMEPFKNHERVVSIFAQLLNREPHARLLLVGRGGNDVEQTVRQRVQRLSIEDKVIFAGLRTDVPRLLKAADLLLFPSRGWEGLPGAVLEACAAGTPVLASDLPSVKEIAAQFDLVTCLPLAADDAEWASTAIRLAQRWPVDADAGPTESGFAGSAFDMQQCIQTFQSVWLSSGSKS